jgi:hypothetical protein
MSPKGPYAKGLVANLWCYWEVVEPVGGRAYGKKVGHWEHALEGASGTPGPFSRSVSKLPWGKQAFSSTSFRHDFLFHQSNGAEWLKPPKLWLKKTLSSFTLIVSGALSQWWKSWLMHPPLCGHQGLSASLPGFRSSPNPKSESDLQCFINLIILSPSAHLRVEGPYFRRLASSGKS